jgi:5-methylcytosine-specific restriction protein A
MTRASFRARGYDAQWDQIAREFKARHPLCLGCWAVGLDTPTELIDHIMPLSHDRDRLLDPTNLQPSCSWHHSVIKRHIELLWSLNQLPASALRLDSPHATKLTRERYLIPVGVDGYRLWEWSSLKRRPYPSSGD